MTRPLIALLALLLVASGCGDDGDEPTASDPATTSSPASTPSGTGEVTPEDIAATGRAPSINFLTVVSESAVDGEVSRRPTFVVDDPGLRGFVSQFTDDRMAAALEAELTDYEPSDGMLLAATVIAIGCDEPYGVSVDVEGGGILVDPVADKAVPPKQCLVPVTSVALYELGLPR